MLVTGTLQGVCMARYSPEDVIPKAGIQVPSLVALISATYQARLIQNAFELLTSESPTAPGLIPTLVFVNGQYSLDDNPISINQIVIANNGITITTNNTDSSSEVMSHIFSISNTQMGFRFGELERKYFSSMVVEFDKAIDNGIERLAKARELIEQALGKKPQEFSLTKLAFGPESRQPIMGVNIENIDQVEFSIERRRGQPFSARRYFCSAALTTKSHIAVLEKIEQAFFTVS